MAKGSGQTNRWTGDWLIHLHGYGSAPPRPVPVPWNLDDDPEQDGTPNQIDSGIAVGLRANRPMAPLSQAAREQAIKRLEWQQDHGHCCHAAATETLSDGHSPIELLAQSSGMMTASEIQSGIGKPGEPERRRLLLDLYLGWWARELYLEDLHYVPTGPLAGCVVANCGRFKAGNSDTRNVCYRLIRTGRSGKPAKYFEAAKRYQDNLASVIVRDLVAAGAFKGLKTVEPVLPFELTVEHFHNGHISRTDRPLQHGDPTCVWVTYDDGQIGTSEPPVKRLGDRERVMTVGRRAT